MPEKGLVDQKVRGTKKVVRRMLWRACDDHLAACPRSGVLRSVKMVKLWHASAAKPGRLLHLMSSCETSMKIAVAVALPCARPLPAAAPTHPSGKFGKCLETRKRNTFVDPLAPYTGRWSSMRDAKATGTKQLRLRYRASLANLDPFTAEEILARPCCLFRVPPQFCKGVLRKSLHLVLDLIRSSARAPGDVSGPDSVRAWKLWFLLPRMLLHRPPGGARVQKAVLLARFQAFLRGDWIPLLQDALAQPSPHVATGDRPAASDDARARRAVHLAHLGELSAARQALTADPLAPATDATFEHLSDPHRRPPEPYGPLDPELLAWEPASPVALDRAALLTNLRRARKGAAPGPSGFTAEVVHVVLDADESIEAFAEVATLVAQARIPAAVMPAFGLGRVVALCKPNGGTRGLVVGELSRARLLSSSPAPSKMRVHISSRLAIVQVLMPWCTPCKLGARAILASPLFLLMRLPPTTASAVRRFYRNSGPCLQQLRYSRLLGFGWAVLRPLCGSKAPLLGTSTKPKALNKGTPSAPPCSVLVCSLLSGTCSATSGRTSESASSRIDDVTLLASPQRVLYLVRRFEHDLAHHTRLRLNVGKTAVWNSGGVAPDGLHELSPDAHVWFGDLALEPSARGIVLLGTPFGEPEFVARHLQALSARHEGLLASLPQLGDTQVSWLLLLYTAAPRAQFALRTLAPCDTREFALAHDARVLSALSGLLLADGSAPLPPAATRVAQLALRDGGLGLRSAALHAPAAFWASWADAVPILRSRDAPLAESLVHALDARDAVEWSPVQNLLRASDALAEAGFAVPQWAAPCC